MTQKHQQINPTTNTIVVHKQGEEGILELDTLTGIITTDLMDRPEWSEGLAVALLGDRHGYYMTALGQQYADEHKFPETLAFEDLDWLAHDDEDAGPVRIEHDPEFRQNVVAEVLGVVTEDVAAEDDIAFKDGHVPSLRVDVDIPDTEARIMGSDEFKALEEDISESFGSKTGTSDAR